MPPYSDQPASYLRDYESEVLQARVFGAFLTAVEHRKEKDNLTRRKLADSLGKDETNVSKLLSAPRNWQLSTIAELALALDLKFHFALEDLKYNNVFFLDTGCVDLKERNSVATTINAIGNVVFSAMSTTSGAVAISGNQGDIYSKNFQTSKFVPLALIKQEV